MGRTLGMVSIAGLAIAATACSPFGGGAFTCSDSAQCGPAGLCEPNGLCSFVDPACSSGRRYGDGGDLGGSCVSDGSIDAPPGSPDAAVDALPLVCPVTYTVSLPSTTTRYRIIPTDDVYWDHAASCEADAAGKTHAAVLDTVQEAIDLEVELALVTPMPNQGRFYVGAVQRPDATERDQDWIGLTGAPVSTGLWGIAASMQQPDDGGSATENQVEQLAVIQVGATYLLDVRGNASYGMVCECDGLAIDATAAQYVADDPNNPN